VRRFEGTWSTTRLISKRKSNLKLQQSLEVEFEFISTQKTFRHFFVFIVILKETLKSPSSFSSFSSWAFETNQRKRKEKSHLNAFSLAIDTK
jgi:hypothetical protein